MKQEVKKEPAVKLVLPTPVSRVSHYMFHKWPLLYTGKIISIYSPV